MRFVAAAMILCVSASALAHDSLQHTAERLDALLLDELSVAALIERADVHRELGEFQAANALLQEAARLEPDNPAAWIAHAENDAHFEHHEQVVIASTRHLEIAGPTLRGLWLRADALAEIGALDSARDDCNALAELEPNVEVSLLCADVLASLGEQASALETLERGHDATGAAVLLVAAFEQALELGEFEQAAALAERGTAYGTIHTTWLLRHAIAVEAAGDEALAHALRAEALVGAAAAVARRDSCLNRVAWVESLAALRDGSAEVEAELLLERCSSDSALRARLSRVVEAVR